MFDDRIGNLQKMLARMGPEGRQRYAADHADDPIAVSMALFVNNIAKELKEGKRGEPEMQAPVVQQAIQAMNQPSMPPQGMPPQGQPQAPQQAPQAMPPQAPQQQAPQQQAPQQQAPQQQGQTRRAADGGYMDSRLPEEMGIGALPERSLSNMADGGIVGFAKGGDSGPGTTADYRRYALKQAAEMGLDPQFVDSILSHESRTKDYPTGYDPNAESGTGSVGIGQLLAGTGKFYGVEPNERKNPIKNIDASLRFMKDLQSKYNNDPRLMAVAYNQGETVLNRHLAKNNKVLVPANLQKEIAEDLTKAGKLSPEQVAQRAVEPVNYLKRTVDKPKDTTNPFGGAAAPATEPAPPEQGAAFGIFPKSGVRTAPKATAAAANEAANEAAARDALVAQIPGGSGGTSAPAPVDTRTIFGKGADYLGIPEGFQRDFNNTLNALGGYSSPVAAAKSMGAANELAATPEMIAKAAEAKRVAETLRLAPPVKAGIAALPQEAQVLRAEAEAAKRARFLAEDRKAAQAAEDSVKAANATSKIASEVEAANLAKQAATTANTAKAANAAKAGVAAQGAAQATVSPPEPTASWDKQITDRDFADVPNPVKKEAVAEATKAIMASPEPDRLKGFGYEDLMMFGLQLMANKSQYFGTAVGEAGVAALAAKQAREKTEYDRRKTDAEIKGLEATARYHGAAANRYALEDKPQMAYQKALEAEVAALDKNMTYQLAKPAEKLVMENAARARAKTNFLAANPELADTMGDGGFKVLGSRASP